MKKAAPLLLGLLLGSYLAQGAALANLEGHWLVENESCTFQVDGEAHVYERKDLLGFECAPETLDATLGEQNICRLNYRSGSTSLPFGAFNGGFEIVDRENVAWKLKNRSQLEGNRLIINSERSSELGSRGANFVFTILSESKLRLKMQGTTKNTAQASHSWLMGCVFNRAASR